MSYSNWKEHLGGGLVFFMVLVFLGYGIAVTTLGWIGIEEELGFWWGVAAVILAFFLRFTIPITIGAIFGAMHLWGWHWTLATFFAIPGLAFMIPAIAAIIFDTFKSGK
jgi:hypothetical protein